MRATRLAARLGIDLPLVQAPLGGGPGTPALTAAACEAGCLGVLGGGYLDPDDLRAAVRDVSGATRRPFGVNVFLAPPARERDTSAVRRRLARVAAELGIEVQLPTRAQGLPDVDEQLEVLLASAVPVVTFTFGCPDPALVARLHRQQVTVMVTVGTVAEARAAQDCGADAVVAQGSEAGGHRGGWTGVEPPDLAALLPAVVGAVRVPVVAAGGLMDGRDVAAALALGAQAAQLGTAFLRTAEAGTNQAYREALRHSDGTTVVTSSFSGRPARGLPNAYLAAFGDETDLPGFPTLNYLTRPIRTASAEQGRADAQSLWAGQGVARGRDLSVAELVAALVAEAAAAQDSAEAWPASEALDGLNALRTQRAGQVAALERALASMVGASEDSNADDEHDPEGATIAFERAQLSAQLAHARSGLADIDAALTRVREGRSGRCTVCGQAIDRARMEARPTAQTCVGCASGSR